jgi:hypothetical protein
MKSRGQLEITIGIRDSGGGAEGKFVVKSQAIVRTQIVNCRPL